MSLDDFLLVLGVSAGKGALSRQQAREFALTSADVKHHEDGRFEVARYPLKQPFQSNQTAG
jgi:hypothetical protein